MQQVADVLRVSGMVVRRPIAQEILPCKQIIEFAPWMIERARLELPDVRKVTRRVHEGRRFMSITHNDEQAQLLVKR
jgi:hypothetical protein